MWAATPSRCAIRSVLLRLALVVPCACFVLPAAPRAARPSRLLATLEKPSGPGRLIIVRHGETPWNHNDTFTGWADVDLSERGARSHCCARAAQARAEVSTPRARARTRIAAALGPSPTPPPFSKVDVAYTSALKRAIR